MKDKVVHRHLDELHRKLTDLGVLSAAVRLQAAALLNENEVLAGENNRYAALLAPLLPPPDPADLGLWRAAVDSLWMLLRSYGDSTALEQLWENAPELTESQMTEAEALALQLRNGLLTLLGHLDPRYAAESEVEPEAEPEVEPAP